MQRRLPPCVCLVMLTAGGWVVAGLVAAGVVACGVCTPIFAGEDNSPPRIEPIGHVVVRAAR